MKSWLRSRRFFVQTLSLTICLLLILCILFVAMLYSNSRRSTTQLIYQTESERTAELLHQADIHLSQIIEVGFSYVILNLPHEQFLGLGDEYTRRTLNSMLESHMSAISYISNIDIESFNIHLHPSVVAHERNLGTFYFYEIQCAEKTVWPYSFDLITKDKMYPNRVTLTLDGYFLSQQIFSAQSGERAEYLLMPDGTVLLSNQRTAYFKDIQECLPGIILEETSAEQQKLGIYADQYYVLSAPDKYGFRILSLVPQALYESQQEAIVVQTILLSAIFLLVAILVSLFLVARFYRPIKKTVEMLQTYIPDDLHEYENEIAYIHQNITKFAAERSEDESLTQIQKAQTAVMQYQINSHFLFNTLENIMAVSIVELGMGNKIESSIMLLNTIIREGVFQKNIFVSLSHELHLSKCYLGLMQLRFPDVEVTWDVDDTLSRCKVFKFSLQPILENCFAHAFLENTDEEMEKHISVSVKKNAHDFSIFVADNGTGIKTEMIRHLEQILRTPDEIENAGHVGIHNVHKRITDTFGPDYGIRFTSTPSGTLFELRYPISDLEEIPG